MPFHLLKTLNNANGGGFQRTKRWNSSPRLLLLALIEILHKLCLEQDLNINVVNVKKKKNNQANIKAKYNESSSHLVGGFCFGFRLRREIPTLDRFVFDTLLS